MIRVLKRIKNYFIDLGFFGFISDEKFLKYKYKSFFRRELNLKDPIFFTEKLQWLKLNYRDEKMSMLVDKYAVKHYINEKVRDRDLHTIPTFGVFDKFSDIPFDKLPKRFVIKCTHDSGSVTVVRDKNKLNYWKERLYFSFKQRCNFYNRYREWPYKNVKPRILVEQFMEDDKTDALTDYKFFCFDGEPKFMYISKDDSHDPRTDFFDMDYNHLDLRLRDPNADILPKCPKEFGKMKKLASKLSKGFPFVRVDFYVINSKIYFGEFTFYHLGGFFYFHPEEWDRVIGDMLKLKKFGDGNE